MDSNYDYTSTLKELWDKALDQYGRGGRNVNMFFNGVELEFLRSIGATPGAVYDFIEDVAEQGEPTWETFLLVQAARRDYFLTAQEGKWSEISIDVDAIPAKTDAVRDIVWLPRLIAKAKAKLRGELPTTLMYGCGGDRKFFKTHDIHPADFLRATWAYEEDDEALIDWVIARSKQNQTGTIA
jgi:hypothetical protein